MNIYDYIVSSDVAAHCKKIGHVFNPLDMAVIVALSEKTAKEKHAAWRHIAEHYPDMPIHKRPLFRAKKSLHNYLGELIAWEEKQLADFYAPGRNVAYRPVVSFGNSGLDHERIGCYSTAEKAWAAIIEYCDRCKADDGADWFAEVRRLVIHKLHIDAADGDYDSLEVNRDGEAMSRWLYHGADDPGDLKNIFIHIPVPFEKGDLVEYNGKPGVIMFNLPHTKVEFYERCVSGGTDGSDMNVTTYFWSDDFGFVHDHPLYHELKFFTGQLEGMNRFLKYLGRYLKEKEKNDGILLLIDVFRKLEAEAENERMECVSRSWSPFLDEDDERKPGGNKL